MPKYPIPQPILDGLDEKLSIKLRLSRLYYMLLIGIVQLNFFNSMTEYNQF